MALTLVATLNPTTASTSLVLTWTTAPVPTTATINRVAADGSVYPVRNAEPAALVAGVWAGDDYEAPLDMAFHYEATSTDVPGVTITSATYTLDSGGQVWLKHPGQPALNVVVTPTQPPDWTRPVRQGVFEVLGRSHPVAVTMMRGSERGTLGLYTFTDDQRVALVAILGTGATLLFQTPSGLGLGSLYVAVGEVSEVRPAQRAPEASRVWALPLTVVDRPSGAALSTVTWSDVLGNHATWADVGATRATWLDVLQDA